MCKIELWFIFLLKLFRNTSSTNLVSAFSESEDDKKDLSLGIKKSAEKKKFFGTIKVEKYYLNKYNTLYDLKNDIKEYIRFYDEERLQKNLGNRSPLEYRKLKEKMSIIELSTWQGTDQTTPQFKFHDN